MSPLTLIALASLAARAEEVPTYESRPTVVLIGASLGGPEGIAGGRVGHKSWELGGGIGATGYQASAQWKHYWQPFDSTILSFPLGLGPSVGLGGPALGSARTWGGQGGPALLFASWLNGEISAEWRARWGGVWRWTLGGALRLLENQSQLCEDVLPPGPGEVNDCYGMHIPTGPIVAALPAFPYIGFSYGYAF